MTNPAAGEAKLEDMWLRAIAAPPGPRFIYSEPHLSNVERLALIEGRMFFVRDRSRNLMPLGALHVGLFAKTPASSARLSSW